MMFLLQNDILLAKLVFQTQFPASVYTQRMTLYVQLCLHVDLMGCLSSASECTEVLLTSSHTCSNSSCVTALFSVLAKQLEATILSYKRLSSSS